MKEDIKPCPFCGAKGKQAWIEFDGCRLWCRFCGARGPITTTKYEEQVEEDIIAKWNRRKNG